MLGRFIGPCMALTFFRGRILRKLKALNAVLLLVFYPPAFGKKSVRALRQPPITIQGSVQNKSPGKIANFRNAGFGNRPGYVGLNQNFATLQLGGYGPTSTVYPILPTQTPIVTSNTSSFVPYFLLALAGLAIASLAKSSRPSRERVGTPSEPDAGFSPDVGESPANPTGPSSSDRDSGDFDRNINSPFSPEPPKSPRVSRPSNPDLIDVPGDEIPDVAQVENIRDKRPQTVGPSITPFPRSSGEREISSDTEGANVSPTPSSSRRQDSGSRLRPVPPPSEGNSVERSPPDRVDDRAQRPVGDSPGSGPQKMLSVKQRKQLAHGPGLLWDGCDKSSAIQGGQGPRCGVDYLHPSFVKQIDTYLINCLGDAARKVGLQAPAKVFIGHFGCYVNRSIRGGSGLSNHAFARAMDVKDIKMMDSTGRTIASLSAHANQYSGRNKTLYDHFRLCWKKNLPRQCSNQKGSIGIPRSELGGNSSHNDHMHLEFPPGCG